MLTLAVRRARETDFPALLALFEDVAEEGAWIGTEPSFNHDAYQRGWRELAAGRGGALFVATAGGVVVATLSVVTNTAIGCEIGMLVASAHRRLGIGTRLLNEAFGWARAHGVSELALLVFPHNTAAITLYERAGFAATERLEHYKTRRNGEVWDVLLMTRSV